jgi:hypothetical protein
MSILENGDKVSIHRNGAGYVVEHRSPSGNLIDSIECDNMAEAVAALEYGPSRW